MKSQYIQIAFAVLLFIPATCVPGHSQDAQLTTKGKNAPSAVLVELFTSEGCSSCPPADALLRQLDGKYSSSGQLIVGISEHVTYWNHLGWKDPFSAAEYTQRQEAYSKRFHLDSAYTPQMVVNGSQQLVGSDQAALLRALAKESDSLPVTIQIDSIATRDNVLTVGFSVRGMLPSEPAEIFAVIADNIDQSSVLRGENSGRTLSHASVARSLTHLATVRDSTKKSTNISLPLPSQGLPNQERHLVIFAQTPNLGKILGVTSKPLQPPGGTIQFEKYLSGK